MSQALIVFAKPPTPGQVKTRLTPVLTAREAARLYSAFLRDALLQYASLEVDVRLYLASGADEGLPSDWMPNGVQTFAQRGDGLGARMRNAFEETLDAYQRAVIIGTDHPTLPTAFVRQAFEALSAPHTVTIGPSSDGGYYLLGMNAFYPQLFADMRYSHGRVFANTLARVEDTDAQLTVLPQWYDVDTPEDLQQLLTDLERPPNAMPHTRRVIEDLDLEDMLVPEE